jgi:hypothetical protein
MRSRAEQLRARADACDRRAFNSRAPGARTQFLNLASQWRQLADRVERNANEMESNLKMRQIALELRIARDPSRRSDSSRS